MGITRALFLITPPVLSSACQVTICFSRQIIPDVFVLVIQYTYILYFHILPYCILFTSITYVYVYIYIYTFERFSDDFSTLLNYCTWIEDVLATDKAVERWGSQNSS